MTRTQRAFVIPASVFNNRSNSRNKQTAWLLCTICVVWWRSWALCMKQRWLRRGSTQALNNSAIFTLHKRCPLPSNFSKWEKLHCQQSLRVIGSHLLPDLQLSTAPPGARLMLQACASGGDVVYAMTKNPIFYRSHSSLTSVSEWCDDSPLRIHSTSCHHRFWCCRTTLIIT